MPQLRRLVVDEGSLKRTTILQQMRFSDSGDVEKMGQETLRRRYRPDADTRLWWPIAVCSFYLEHKKKAMVSEALAIYVENLIEEALWKLHNNPESNAETLTKNDIPILETALNRVRKILRR